MSRSVSSICRISSSRVMTWGSIGGHSDRAYETHSDSFFPSCAREETPESRGMPCLFLNTERGFGGKPPKKSGFRRHLAGSKMPEEGSKMPKETFFTGSPVGEWSHGARSMPRVFSRGSRSQPAALVSDRDDAALFPAIRTSRE